MDRIISALKTLRIGVIEEEFDLHGKIAAAFREQGIPFQREFVLGQGDRIDFLTEDGTGIEVKKGKPNRTRLIEQIDRYAQHAEIRAVVIVVETSLRFPIKSTPNGKPCAVVGLQKLWGIAL